MKTPNLPPGFTTRNAVFADIPAVVALINAYDQHYLGYQGATYNMIETEWKTPKFNPETDIHLVFNPKGFLAGHIEVWAISDPPVHPSVWVRVSPNSQYKEIGAYLMHWGRNAPGKS